MLRPLSVVLFLSSIALAACGGSLLHLGDRDTCPEFVVGATSWNADLTDSTDRCAPVGTAIAVSEQAVAAHESLRSVILACKGIVSVLDVGASGGDAGTLGAADGDAGTLGAADGDAGTLGAADDDAGTVVDGESARAWCDRAKQSIAKSYALSQAAIRFTAPGACTPSESERASCASCVAPCDAASGIACSSTARCDVIANATGSCTSATVTLSGPNIGVLSETARAKLESDVGKLVGLSKNQLAQVVDFTGSLAADANAIRQLRDACATKVSAAVGQVATDTQDSLSAINEVVGMFAVQK